MAPKPTIVIVPGSFSTASMYYDIVKRIQKEGYEVYVNSLPSTIRNPPEKPATLEDDAVFFRGIIEGLADQGKDIMLLCHSYGGVVGTEAAKGVGKVDRQAKGQVGGITRMAYLAAVVPPEGSSLLDEQGEAPPEIVEVGNVCKLHKYKISPADLLW
jgi:alpha-beta hydrolase superfamily lysophospholipase